MIVFLFKIFACIQQFVVILLETSGENFKKLSGGGEKRKVQNPKIYEIKLVKTNGSKIQRSESDFPKLVFPLQSPPSFFFSLCNLSSFFLPCPSIYFEFVVSFFFFFCRILFLFIFPPHQVCTFCSHFLFVHVNLVSFRWVENF